MSPSQVLLPQVSYISSLIQSWSRASQVWFFNAELQRRRVSRSPPKFRSQDRRLIDRVSRRHIRCVSQFRANRRARSIDLLHRRSLAPPRSLVSTFRRSDIPRSGATGCPFLRRPRCKKGLVQQRGRAQSVPWGNGASLLSTCSTRRRKSNSAKARSLDATFLLNLAGRLFLALAWRHSSARAPFPSFVTFVIFLFLRSSFKGPRRPLGRVLWLSAYLNTRFARHVNAPLKNYM